MARAYHCLDSASRGEDGAGGAKEDLDSVPFPDADLDTYLEEVIRTELLSLPPPSPDWGGQTIMA